MWQTPDNLYAEISPASLAVHAVERAAVEFEAAMSGKNERWFFAITDIHLALTAALVETLSGTARVGALIERQQEEWLEYYAKLRVAPEDKDRVVDFVTLLYRARDPANERDMYGTLTLTDREMQDLKMLHGFRNDVAHVKPVGWYLEIAGLPRIFSAAAKVLHQLFQMGPLQIHLEEDELERAEKAIAFIRR